jgi:formylglycine-generating enzyme required for sulfatase activity
MYKTGESGYLDIPTDDEHNGWATGLNFTVKGVTFKMIPVEWGDKSFLIGETEVTEGLYYAVTGGTTTTPNMPISGQYYNTFQTFLSKLGAITSMSFRLPTIDEWQYAAKGGSKSLSFTYSGSNTPGDVAWYEGNSNSSKHEVKQKQPNELGLYDMSGNVWEWTSTSASSYNGYSNYYCGGCYSDPASSIKVSSRDYKTTYNYSANSIGLRLALTLK